MKPPLLEIIEQLLAKTSEPPAPGAEPVDVLVALREMATGREAGIAELKETIGPDLRVGQECKDTLAELQDRNARWQAAAEKARLVLSRRATSLTRISKSGYSTATASRTRTG